MKHNTEYLIRKVVATGTFSMCGDNVAQLSSATILGSTSDQVTDLAPRAEQLRELMRHMLELRPVVSRHWSTGGRMPTLDIRSHCQTSHIFVCTALGGPS